MNRRVATLRTKQYGEYRLSAINNSGESIKNRDYLLEFEAKFKKFLNTEKGAWEKSICEKIGGKKSRWTVPLRLELIIDYRTYSVCLTCSYLSPPKVASCSIWGARLPRVPCLRVPCCVLQNYFSEIVQSSKSSDLEHAGGGGGGCNRLSTSLRPRFRQVPATILRMTSLYLTRHVNL